LSNIPAKETECNRAGPDGRDHAWVPSAHRNFHGGELCDGEQKASANQYPRKTHRRRTCAAVFNIARTAQPSVARSVKDSLVSFGTTRVKPPSVQRNALSGSKPVERLTANGYVDFRLPDNPCGANPASAAMMRTVIRPRSYTATATSTQSAEKTESTFLSRPKRSSGPVTVPMAEITYAVRHSMSSTHPTVFCFALGGAT
jgi:hypothetical protein